MDPLVRRALGIGDAPWPPDYATLLGLNPTEASADEVEAAVLERMERLRQFQIRLPEPVTEAMNLLARALDDLTCPPSDAPLPATDENAPIAVAPAATTEVPPTSVSAPELDAESAVGVFAPPPQPKVFAASARRVRPARTVAVLPPLKPYAEPPPWSPPLDPRRRRVYDLTRLRKLLDAWDDIGVLWEGRRFSRGDLIGVVVALRRLARLGDLVPKVAGGALLTWAQSHPGTQALADLSEARRQSLADDWHAAFGLIRDRYETAREASLWRRRWRRHGSFWVAAALLIAALLIVLIRALPRD